MCTGVTYGECVCPGVNVASRRPESRQCTWRDSVMPTAVAQLRSLFHRTSIESRHVERCDSRRSSVNHHGATCL
jgi:hypothetical protein